MQKTFFILALILISLTGICQDQWTKDRDSLIKVLSKSKEDTNKVMTMIWLGAGYLDNHPDSTAYYAKAFGELSEKLHYAVGVANSLSMQAMILSKDNKQDEAIALNLKAIEVARKANLIRVLANVYNNTAIIYYAKGEYELSLNYYLKATTIYEQRNDISSMAFVYGNIAEVYNELKEYKKGYAYSLKGIKLCRSLNQPHGLGSGLLNFSTSLINLQQFDTALTVLHEAKELARKLHDKDEEINVLNNINYAYAGIKKFNLIKANADELMVVAKSIDSKEGFCYASLGYVAYYIDKKNYPEAKRSALNAISIAEKNKLITILKDAYNAVARVGLEQGNIKEFDQFDKLKDSIENVLFSDKILKNSQELETKYSLSKKNAEIDALNKEEKIHQLTLRQENIINWILAGIVFVMIVISFLYNRNFQQKKKLLLTDALLQQQRITELEKEKQLSAAQGVLQGQVEERTRLAKDLHDGLGGILSSAKYSFSNMKDIMIITPENAVAFERSMGMLDKSISELRRVAHNMMPEALVKFGLDTALIDFCNSIVQNGVIQLTYQSFDMDETSISKTTAATVYRIIQELVNNILKHANATNALVQLVRKNTALSITVEDNGKGFDKNILQNNDGIGYLNLQNRVTFLNGSMDIQTVTDKGTSVNIEIPNITV